MSDFLKNLAKNEAESISERLSFETRKELYKIFQKEMILNDIEKIANKSDEYKSLTEEQKIEFLNDAYEDYIDEENYTSNIYGVFENTRDNWRYKDREDF